MNRIHGRQRRVIASVTLGWWIFAFLVGVAQACGLHESVDHLPDVAAASGDRQGHQADDDAHHQYCERTGADQTALLAKLQSVQDPPGGHAILTPGAGKSFLLPMSTAPSLSRLPRPPPGVAAYTLFVRLAL